MSKHFAGITPVEAGYEKVRIAPEYTLSDSMSCTVPSVKGVITLNYKVNDGKYIINITLPEDIQAEIYIPENAEVYINSEIYYQDGQYVNNNSINNIVFIIK